MITKQIQGVRELTAQECSEMAASKPGMADGAVR